MKSHFISSCAFYCFTASILVRTVAGQYSGGAAHCPEFKCPKDDETAMPKSPLDYLVSTGCDSIGGGGISVMGGNDKTKVAEVLAPCCDVYHACLQICGVTKKFCTGNFDKCMKSRCDTIADSNTKKQCDTEVQMKSIMLQMSQCKEFDEGQKNCHCVKKSSVPMEIGTLVYNFYKKHNPKQLNKSTSLAAKATDPRKLAGLLYKLVEKYPKAIKKKKDPRQKQMEDLMKGFEDQKKAEPETTTENIEDEDDQESDEKIEL
jgi:hypothetical protein